MIQFIFSNNLKSCTLSLTEIEEIIEKKKQEMGKLNEEISTLDSRKKELEESIHDQQLKKSEIESELQWDLELSQTLNAKGLQFETVPRFVSAAILLKERGYDVFEYQKNFPNLKKYPKSVLV